MNARELLDTMAAQSLRVHELTHEELRKYAPVLESALPLLADRPDGRVIPRGAMVRYVAVIVERLRAVEYPIKTALEGDAADALETLAAQNAALAEQVAERDAEVGRLKEDAERWNRLTGLWLASTELLLEQTEDGRWSITQIEAVENNMYEQLIGDTPDAAIDAERAGK